MTLKQAQRAAEKAFSGMQSPMTMEQIRQRELEARELSRQTAGAIYDPKIKGSEALGRGQISTTKGVVGQGSGFTLSTAEMTYLNNVQGEVQARTKEIVDAKANYIAQGDFAAAERADQQIASLREYENQLIMAKANYALQLMSGDREQANAILNQQKFAFDQQKFAFDRYVTERQLDNADKKLVLDIASLTGEYEGSPTFAAKQATIQNAMSEAGLTGIYNGNETLDARMKKAQLALQQEGIKLDWARFNETVRSNKVQESLSRARLAQAKAEEEGTPAAYMDATVERLKTLRDAGQLTDANYMAELTVLGTALGYDIDDTARREILQSAVNKAMEGDTQAYNNLGNIVINNDRPLTNDNANIQKEWWDKHPLVNALDALFVKGVYEGGKSIGSAFFGLE